MTILGVLANDQIVRQKKSPAGWQRIYVSEAAVSRIFTIMAEAWNYSSSRSPQKR